MSDGYGRLILSVLVLMAGNPVPQNTTVPVHTTPLPLSPDVCPHRISAVHPALYQPWSAVHSDMCPKGEYMATRKTTSYPFPDASLKTSSFGAFNNTTSLDVKVKSSSRKKTNTTLVLQSGMFMFHTDTLVGSNRTLEVETQANTTGANMSNSSNQYVESVAAFDVPITSVSNSSNQSIWMETWANITDDHVSNSSNQSVVSVVAEVSNSSNQSVISVLAEVSNATTGSNSSNSTPVTWKINKMVRVKKAQRKSSTRPTKNTANRTVVAPATPVETKNSTDDNTTVPVVAQNATEDNTTVPVVAQNATEDNTTVPVVALNATEDTTAINATTIDTNTTTPVKPQVVVETPVKVEPQVVTEVISVIGSPAKPEVNTTGKQVGPYEPETPEDVAGQILSAVVCTAGVCIYVISKAVVEVVSTRGKGSKRWKRCKRGDASSDNAVDSSATQSEAPSNKSDKVVILFSGCATHESLPDQGPTNVCNPFPLFDNAMGSVLNNGALPERLVVRTDVKLNEMKRAQPGVMDTTTINICGIPDRDHTVIPVTGIKVLVTNTLYVFVGCTFGADPRHSTLRGPMFELLSFLRVCLSCKVKVEQLRIFTDVSIKELLDLIDNIDESKLKTEKEKSNLKEEKAKLKENVQAAVNHRGVFLPCTSLELIRTMIDKTTPYQFCMLVISTHTSMDPSAPPHRDTNLLFPNSPAMNEVSFWLMLLACKYTVFAFLFTCHAGGYMKGPEEAGSTAQRGGQTANEVESRDIAIDVFMSKANEAYQELRRMYPCR